MSSEPPYEKLPGRGSTVVARHRLHLGADHILAIESNGFHETYRRFFFRDIQAISLRRTPRGGLASLILLIVTLWLGLVGFLSSDPGVGSVMMGGAVLFLVLLLYSLVLGPTCVCQIQTGVQSTRLHALSRMRAARAFLGKVRPFIEAAQVSSAAAAPDGSVGSSLSPEASPTPASGATEADPPAPTNHGPQA
mgnify:CR=1 FL=1